MTVNLIEQFTSTSESSDACTHIKCTIQNQPLFEIQLRGSQSLNKEISNLIQHSIKSAVSEILVQNKN